MLFPLLPAEVALAIDVLAGLRMWNRKHEADFDLFGRPAVVPGRCYPLRIVPEHADSKLHTLVVVGFDRKVKTSDPILLCLFPLLFALSPEGLNRELRADYYGETCLVGIVVLFERKVHSHADLKRLRRRQRVEVMPEQPVPPATTASEGPSFARVN